MTGFAYAKEEKTGVDFHVDVRVYNEISKSVGGLRCMYGIGKVASETNLTVRTLRYYDEINLLRPSHVAESGYRYYSKKDVLKLHRILALKELGFNLNQIKEILDQNQWKNVFEEHLAYIAKERERLSYLEKLSRLCLQLSIVEQDISWDNIFRYVRQSREGQRQKTKFLNEYFDERELEILNNPLLDIGEEEAMALVDLLKTAHEQKHEDPYAPKSQALAERLARFLNDAFHGDDTLINKYWELQKRSPEELALIVLDQDVIQYIDDIMDVYAERLEEGH